MGEENAKPEHNHGFRHWLTSIVVGAEALKLKKTTWCFGRKLVRIPKVFTDLRVKSYREDRKTLGTSSRWV